MQKKPREAKEAQRLLQERLEKAEGLLRQAGITMPATQPSFSAAAQHGSPWAVSAPLEPRSQGVEYTRSHLLDSEMSIDADRLPDIECIPLQSRLNNSLPSPFNHLPPTFGNSTPLDTETRDATLTPRDGFKHIAMAPSYAGTSPPSAATPHAPLTISNILHSGFKGPPSSTDALQLHGAALSVHGTEPAVCDLCIMYGLPKANTVSRARWKNFMVLVPHLPAPATTTDIYRLRILPVNLQQPGGRVGF